MKINLAISASFVGILFMMANAAPNSTPYKDLLPDTLLPGNSYTFRFSEPAVLSTATAYTPAPKIYYSSQYLDTVVLKNKGTTIRMLGSRGTEGSFTYTLNIPIDAEIGFYSVYSPKGLLLDTNAAFLPNVNTIRPQITELSRVRGLRGVDYQILVSSMGLAFGPLQKTGAFISAVKKAELNLNGSRIALTTGTNQNPYSQSFKFLIPNNADLGYYRLVIDRLDGLQTVQENAFEVWMPAAPIIEKVNPDTLVAGLERTLTITGVNMDYGVTQGSYIILNTQIVKEVQLVNKEIVLPITQFSFLGYAGSHPMGIVANFHPPVNFPPGRYDLGLVLYGRSDTSFLRNAIQVIPLGDPQILSVNPRQTGKSLPLSLDINTRNLQSNLSKASFSLLRGSMVWKGSYSYQSLTSVTAAFFPNSTLDTGYYDLQIVDTTGKKYQLARAVRIMLPEIGSVQVPSLVAGKSSLIEIGIKFQDFETTIIDNGPTQASATTSRQNIRRVQLCQASNCFDGSNSFFRQQNYPEVIVSTEFFPYSNQPPGIYNLEVGLLEPNKSITKPAVVLLAPPGFEPWMPAYGGSAVAYWHIYADSLATLGLPLPSKCSNADHKLEVSLTGMSFENGTLSWRPTQSDTGWHYIQLLPISPCTQKLFLAAFVDSKTVAGIRSKSSWNNSKDISSIKYVTNDGFKISILNSAKIDLFDLAGHNLASFANLNSGEHFLTFSQSVKPHFILLCRVREDSGEKWMRIMKEMR